MTGIILKSISGVYSVITQDEVQIDIKACGKFRKDRIVPMVGDRVEVSNGLITRVLPRKNQVLGPPVANIDLLAIVICPKEPEPDFLLVDNLLLHAELLGFQVLLAVNKSDLYREQACSIAQSYRDSGCTCVCTSSVDKTGIAELKSHLQGKFFCFTGQSAVGKSSLLNACFSNLELQTGGLSRRTERGRHTTRHCSAFNIDGCVVADTPGFSLLDYPYIEPEQLSVMYSEFEPYTGKCRFDGCMHLSEPGCAVRKAVDNKLIDSGRYQRYTKILDIMKQKRREIYD